MRRDGMRAWTVPTCGSPPSTRPSPAAATTERASPPTVTAPAAAATFALVAQASGQVDVGATGVQVLDGPGQLRVTGQHAVRHGGGGAGVADGLVRVTVLPPEIPPHGGGEVAWLQGMEETLHVDDTAPG